MSRIRRPAARLSTLRISANSPRTDSRLADAALMQMNIEFGGDVVTQVSTAPAHHAIGLEVRAVFYPLRHFAPLGFGQTKLTPRPGPVQPSQAIRVVAMHPGHAGRSKNLVVPLPRPSIRRSNARNDRSLPRNRTRDCPGTRDRSASWRGKWHKSCRGKEAGT